MHSLSQKAGQGALPAQPRVLPREGSKTARISLKPILGIRLALPAGPSMHWLSGIRPQGPGIRPPWSSHEAGTSLCAGSRRIRTWCHRSGDREMRREVCELSPDQDTW